MNGHSGLDGGGNTPGRRMLWGNLAVVWAGSHGKPCPLLQGEGDVPDFYANTAEDVEKLREIIALADRRCLPDLSAVGRIIKEEISGYNAGVMTAEQTAEKIQNRVQLYLDEHR